MQQASELAERTREDRNRYADFLRVLAIVAVVSGHWMVIDLQLGNGFPTGVNALTESSWVHWGTWVFQVIPIFFLVGGYANAVSWRAHRDRGHDWASWLRRRSLRLLWPTAFFVAAGLVLTPIAAWASIPDEILAQASWAVAFILWFLAVYLGVAVLTPVAIRAHDRWGLWFIAALTVSVAVIDGSRFLGEAQALAYANYALVWAAFHQIGFAWKDGLLPSGRRAIPLTILFGAVLVLLVLAGPYPVSMVGVPNADIQNTGPPTMALLALGITQIGLVMSLLPVVAPKLESSRLWTIVVSGNLVIMSLFLWHVVPVVILAVVLSSLGVTLPGETGSLTWLAFRPVWVLMLTILLVPLVLIVRYGERPAESVESLVRRQGRSRLTLALGLVGVATTCAGLARLTLEGFWAGQPTLIPLWGAFAFFGGAGLAIGAGGLASRPEDSRP